MRLKKFSDVNSKISHEAFADEIEVVRNRLSYINLNDDQNFQIQREAIVLVEEIRKFKRTYIDDFIAEFSLSNEEGVAIMCLAEGLLRIPDRKTAMALIDDKLAGKEWGQHFNKDRNLLVNFSSFGLLLTGSLINLAKTNFVGKVLGKMSKPLILKSVKRAIQIISNKYILGDNITTALQDGSLYTDKGYVFSIDLLGESSRSESQANHYYQEYLKALDAMSSFISQTKKMHDNHNLSLKLSALHPKVLLRKKDSLRLMLLPRIKHIINLCRELNISISFDAEEAYRQDIYLDIISELISDPEFKGFNGIGVVVQAYSKRTFHIIDYLAALANSLNKQIPIRLVKGAYWDGEIKFAQEYGLEGYPVFTRKEYTDVSYIACAQKILSYKEVFYPQFATHNAHTVSTIIALTQDYKINFEFQRLQGMGEELHDIIVKRGFRSRIYAPVGKYEDLLAYLMRRLLENGANSSFMNHIYNNDFPVTELVASPITRAYSSLLKAQMELPQQIYGALRENSTGYDLGYQSSYDEVANGSSKYFNKQYTVKSITEQKTAKSSKMRDSFMPADFSQKISEIHYCTEKDIEQALETANKFKDKWASTKVSVRADMLRRFARTLHENRYEFYAILLREGGKNIDDAISEVREAIDFAYYYASKAEELMGEEHKLPGYTGESNSIHYHGRGVFVCISPWNFPLAIFCGQILAALATGNTVIAKPADLTSTVAHMAVNLMHEAGVPPAALQLLIAKGSEISKLLLTQREVAGVCLTGSTEVAWSINRTLAARNAPIASFIAETGGQNAMIIDSSALIEQATDAIINSAFGSSGQRCSALRVAYIQEDIYDKLLDLVIGATNELSIGNTCDLSCDLGPVISLDSKSELLAHAKSIVKKNGCMEVAKHKQFKDLMLEKGSYCVPHIFEISHISDLEKENFGPMLHLRKFKANEFEQVVTEINSTGYGLTFGLQTRIEERINHISSLAAVGNFYANRTMIGAQVGTHPFGGEGNSGTGFKAGGPNYLLRFVYERVKTINTAAIGGNLELLRRVL